MMTPLDYLSDVPFECGPRDANVAAFIEATSIIRGCDAVEEFLACGIWSLSEKCDFEVETKETPLSKVVVLMPKVTPVIGMKQLKAAFETRRLCSKETKSCCCGTGFEAKESHREAETCKGVIPFRGLDLCLRVGAS
jgi:hypothetical protein